MGRLVTRTSIVAGGGGGGDALFAMDYDPGAFPDSGWPTGSARSSTGAGTYYSVLWSRSHIVGGGPSGENCYRISLIYDAGPPQFGGEHSYGLGSGTAITLPAAGSSAFFRWRHKFVTGTDFNGRDDAGASPSVMRTKWLIVGDGSAVDRSRIIIGSSCDPGATPEWNWNIGIDGGEDQFTTGQYITIGSWFNVQVEIRYSSALDVADGYYRIWINNNTYASPTAGSGAIIVNKPDNNTLSHGYENNGLASGGTYSFDHTGFEFDDAFVSM